MVQRYTSLYKTDPTTEEQEAGIQATSVYQGSPYALANVPEFEGVQYATPDYRRYQDLYSLYMGGGFPAASTTTPPAAPPGGGDSGGGGVGTGGTGGGTGGDNTYIGGGASLEDAGGTYPGGYHSAEGGFEYTGTPTSDPFLASGAAGGARLPSTSPQEGFLASGAAGGARLPTAPQEGFLASGAAGGARLPTPTYADGTATLEDAGAIGRMEMPGQDYGYEITPQAIDPTGMLPQTSTSPFMIEGALGVDPREKQDFISEADVANPQNLLQRLGLPADFDIKGALIESGINLAAGVPISLIARALGAVLPDRDPRQTALDEFYATGEGAQYMDPTSPNYIPGMENYNIVSGGGLYTLTGGKVGEKPTYGLQDAYQDRIDTVENTLQDKYGLSAKDIADIKAGTFNPEKMNVQTDLVQRLVDLENAKAAEKGRLDLFSGDVDERDQMLEDIVAQNKAEAEGDAIRLRQLTGDWGDLETATGIPDAAATIIDEPIKIEKLKTQEEQEMLDEVAVEEIADIADRQPEVIETKKNELAEIYDRQVERGEREDKPTVTSKINKAKEVIGMPQMLGDVGGGDDRGGGGGGKIVCTMMNESYGFGSFRNKIWLKHSKDLAPEYQRGYHKLFLPLVKYAKQDGTTNRIIKKVLEHIAVHRTIDIRQEARGKRHLLGRIYRRILEPICYWAGK